VSINSCCRGSLKDYLGRPIRLVSLPNITSSSSISMVLSKSSLYCYLTGSSNLLYLDFFYTIRYLPQLCIYFSPYRLCKMATWYSGSRWFVSITLKWIYIVCFSIFTNLAECNSTIWIGGVNYILMLVMTHPYPRISQWRLNINRSKWIKRSTSFLGTRTTLYGNSWLFLISEQRLRLQSQILRKLHVEIKSARVI